MKGKENRARNRAKSRNRQAEGNLSKENKGQRSLHHYGFTKASQEAVGLLNRSHMDAESKKVDFSGSYVSRTP
jgi:hypothetical protein